MKVLQEGDYEGFAQDLLNKINLQICTLTLQTSNLEGVLNVLVLDEREGSETEREAERLKDKMIIMLTTIIDDDDQFQLF